MNYCLDMPHWAEIVGSWLYNWQTLIAGLIALIAAGIGFYAINRQTQTTADLARLELDHRHNAARCVLPFALSSISAICQQMADSIAEEFEARKRPGFDQGWEEATQGSRRRQFDNLALSEEVIGVFRNFVETLSDHADVAHIGQLLSQIQILLARWNSFNLTQISVNIQLISILVNVGTVALLNDSLFNYARIATNEKFSIVGTKEHDDVWDAIRGKVQGLLFRRPSPDLFFGDLDDLIDRQKKHGTSPWIEKFEE